MQQFISRKVTNSLIIARQNFVFLVWLTLFDHKKKPGFWVETRNTNSFILNFIKNAFVENSTKLQLQSRKKLCKLISKWIRHENIVFNSPLKKKKKLCNFCFRFIKSVLCWGIFLLKHSWKNASCSVLLTEIIQVSSVTGTQEIS